MTEGITIALFIGSLLVLLVLGIPIAWSLLIAGTIGAVVTVGVERTIGLAYTTAMGQVSTYLFATIPMFILMAEFLSKSQIVEKVFYAMYVWLYKIRGGLAMATTVANGGMAALSGSSTAAAASMAKISIPEMRKYDYSERLASGTVAAAGTFAIMLPPSLGLIIYGIITDNNIARLFVAGILPGIITIIGYLLLIFLWGRYNKEAVGYTTDEYFSLKERLGALKPIYPAAILVIIVIGGLYGGVMTPTESGAIGAAGALFLGVVFADLGFKGINEALADTLRVTVMIFMILIGAMIFGRFLIISGITPYLVAVVEGAGTNRWIILFVILFIYLLMGTVMSQSAILILTLPVTYPMVVEGLGFGPYWFGIILVKTAEIGLVTPPLGLNVFVVSGSADVDVNTTFLGVIPFLAVDIVVIFLLMAFPQIIHLLI